MLLSPLGCWLRSLRQIALASFPLFYPRPHREAARSPNCSIWGVGETDRARVPRRERFLWQPGLRYVLCFQ